MCGVDSVERGGLWQWQPLGSRQHMPIVWCSLLFSIHEDLQLLVRTNRNEAKVETQSVVPASLQWSRGAPSCARGGGRASGIAGVVCRMWNLPPERAESGLLGSWG